MSKFLLISVVRAFASFSGKRLVIDEPSRLSAGKMK